MSKTDPDEILRPLILVMGGAQGESKVFADSITYYGSAPTMRLSTMQQLDNTTTIIFEVVAKIKI